VPLSRGGVGRRAGDTGGHPIEQLDATWTALIEWRTAHQPMWVAR